MMGKRILVDAKTWEDMVNKLREYKEANSFLNKQIESYNKKFGKLEKEYGTHHKKET